ncbi:hypothetical protein HPQ64_03640 [Rhizobiales bacterium]|uniref:hypothetical protein n=1 Tax=Hongsoonwoonella zoysiae TaxID=2821844 RepID=UPI00155FBD0F|nr:hypothetical protein [Hongsoonwoonella zoysiae]NRG16780.1 hypothetical protein [Hongsoonwoonella zoysiae]
MTERTSRFNARINIERSILSTINSSHCCINCPLAGLSSGAIEDWRVRAFQFLPKAAVEDIVYILIEIGRRAGFLADNSRGVFEGNDNLDKIYVADIQNKIKNIFKKYGYT